MLNVATNGRRLCGRYTLLEKLGAGGQGEVWRARDETHGGEVALKILSPALARSEAAYGALEREHEIVARLDHPGILRVYPPERDGDVVVLPMELAAGGDLRRLRGGGYLEIVPVLIELAQALEHAHERGVVHRDLKPGNVLFDSRGRVRLADFGVAAGPNPGAARGGMSPFSASPEQLRGEPPAVSDDVYSLGALAYELLSGYPPYYPRFDLTRVLEEPVPELRPVHQTPPRLTALVMRMLAKRPDLRPRSMREVIDELDTALNDTLTFEFEEVDPEPAPVVASALRVEPARPTASNVAFVSDPHRLPERAAAPMFAGVPPAAERAAPPEEPMVASGAGPTHANLWDDLRIEPAPRALRLEPVRSRRWPWVALTLLVAAAVGVFYWLPQFAPTVPVATTIVGPGRSASPSSTAAPTAAPAPPAAATQEPAAADAEKRVQETRARFDERLAGLDKRGAGIWGGPDFAAARVRAAEAVGAFDAGNPPLALARLDQALKHLDAVEARAAQSLDAQLDAGNRALEAGDPAAARHAFELASRIAPDDRRAAAGLRRAQALDEVLPLLAEAENAEAEQDHARAVRAYEKALGLDPENARAKAGLARARAARGADDYAKAVGEGFAALGAGRLDRARTAFERAKAIRPNGQEAQQGLKRVDTALRARGFAAVRSRAAALEAEERWSEALQEYEAALRIDPSLAFARQGRERAAARAELAQRLQSFIDEPQRLAAPAVRAEAVQLIERARQIEPSGPVLRSQIARLEILLPEFDKPVRLALVSDNATQVAIQRVGSFGTFSRREIELKPGKYTVIGTRVGYRDVRRDITVAPGQEIQTITVTCVEPI